MSETQEVILERMLGNIPEKYDRSKGSFYYDSVTPTSIEIEKSNSSLEAIPDVILIDTATGKYLERKVADLGLTRKTTTKTTGIVTITGVVGAAITKGEYVASDSANYEFTETTVIPAGGSVDVGVQCKLYGVVGNVPIGAIKYFPKTLSGLQTVTNAEALTNGADEETDDDLRKRYSIKAQTPATSGNKYHYLNWALEVNSVGAAKVFPLASGPGTVTVIITNSQKKAASSDLVKTAFDYIEDLRPIGCTLTVASATEKPINITADVAISAGLNLGTLQTAFNTAVTEYLQEVAFDATYVSIAKIGALLLDVVGIEDYSNLKINGVAENATLADSEIAVMGSITLGVM